MRLTSSSSKWYEKTLNPACERALLLITRQIDGELEAGDARDLRMHLAACAKCRKTLEVQTAQSRLLSKKLNSLWTADDRAARKKKLYSAVSQWLSSLRIFPKAAACAALGFGVAYFASTACAPSGPAAAQSPKGVEKPAVVSTELKELSRPNTANAASVTAVSPADQSELPAPVDDVAIPTEPCGIVVNAEIEAEAPELADDDDVIFELVPEIEELKVAVRAEQTLAALSKFTPLKPLPDVSTMYSILAESGAREDGRMTVIGDVLNDKGVVHIETMTGQVLECAQSDVDSVLDAQHAAIARRLLSECAAPAHRRRIEEAVRKMGE